MNNLEKKQARLEKLKEQYEKLKSRTDEVAQNIKVLEKQIESEIMADIFREGKTYRMTVADWMPIRGEISKFLAEKYATSHKEKSENEEKQDEK